MTRCEETGAHQYSPLGVRYWNTGRSIPGSGASRVEYYEAFFCSACCDVLLLKLEAESNSYQKPLFGSTPVTEDQAAELRRQR